MAHATLKMNGKEFVLVPKAEFRKLTGQNQRNGTRATSTSPSCSRQEAGDIAEARRRLAEGNFKPYSQLRKELNI